MKPATFEGVNVLLGKDQPEYLPLPAHRTEDGMVTSCWELDKEDLAEINRTHRIWFNVFTFNQPIQPQLPMAKRPKWLPAEAPVKVGRLSKIMELAARLAKWYVGRKLP